MRSDNNRKMLLALTIKFGVASVAIFAVVLIMKSRMSMRKRVQRRIFASLFSRFSSPSLSNALHPFKSRLFSSMNDIVSSESRLATEGKGCIRILEIGIGNGTNLKYYPKGSRLVSVEPNPFFEKFFKKSLNDFPDTIVEQFIEGTAEDMHQVASSSIDAVVSTHVLCSVEDIAKCLTEIKRVLVPGGRFYFVEHVTFPQTYHYSRVLQVIVEPFWTFFCDGCKLSLNIAKSLEDADFKYIDNELVYVDNVYHVMKPHIIGIAFK